MKTPISATTTIYWFRNDLRLEDQPALTQACQQSTRLLLVYCHSPSSWDKTKWNVSRTSQHRQFFLNSALADLRHQLQQQGSDLLEITGKPEDVLPLLANDAGTVQIYCEEIAAPEEQDQVTALRASGLKVTTSWQSSLLNPADLAIPLDALPDVFSHFRLMVESKQIKPSAPLPRPADMSPLPEIYPALAKKWSALQMPAQHRSGNTATNEDSISDKTVLNVDGRSSFPYFLPPFSGGASAAAAHLRQYFDRHLARNYKLTRNDLSGIDYSTKFSPWLASGALSPRTVYQALKEYEAKYGANDSTYWIWFELLWRDYFRFLHLKYGRRLYRQQGLTNLSVPSHDASRFEAWCNSQTGEPLVDAGMAELAATGYLSNRLRQIVASYLVHDLGCDWRAGAAWFESQLIDYDVYSNQGNWLYISGRGTDPRNGRRFNIQKQAHDYDRDGTYQQLWNTKST